MAGHPEFGLSSLLHKATLLLGAETKIHARRIPETVLVPVVQGTDVLQARQHPVQADRPETEMLSHLDIETAAQGHRERGLRSYCPSGDGCVGRNRRRLSRQEYRL